MIKILILILSVLFSVFFAIRNAYQRKEAGVAYNLYNHKWHQWEFLVKTCVALIIGISTNNWFHGIFGVLAFISIDFLLFPLILNIKTKQAWFYLSDSGIDKFLRKFNPVLLFTLKLILLTISLTFYFKNPFIDN